MRMSDVNFINSALRLSKSIETLYNELYELELNDKKDTEEYKQKLDYLKLVIDVENQLYNSQKLDYKRCEELIQFIFNFKLKADKYNDVDSLLEFDYEKAYIARLINSMLILQQDYCEEDNNLFKELEGIAQLFPAKDTTSLISKALSLNSEMLKQFEKDQINCFIYFLNDEIKQIQNEELKSNLLKAKYYTSFLHKEIEPDIINKDFEVDDKFYTSSKLLFDTFQLPEDLYKALLETFYGDTFINQAGKLIYTQDAEYNSYKTSITSFLRYIYLKAMVQLMPYNQVTEMQGYFDRYFKEDGAFLNDICKISKNTLYSIFNNLKLDQNKIYKLSLKK